MLRRLRALLAIAVLLALVAGVPWLLAGTVGNPLSHWAGIRAGDMSDTDVLALVAAIVYVVWATFIAALLVEAPRQLTALVSRRPARSARLHGLGLQQHLARRLITTALMILPPTMTTFGPSAAALAAARPVPSAAAAAAAAATAAPATAAHGSRPPHHRPAASTTSTAEQTTGQPDNHRMYRIPETGGLRTYWAIAEHYLGNGSAWRQVWSLNEGSTQADGSVMSSASRLQPGWTVLLPTHARPDDSAPATSSAPSQRDIPTVEQPDHVGTGEHDVTVHRGDTLSDLAAADGVTDWHEVWPANEGRPEPVGRHFTDPNLILPGWTIELPENPSTTRPPVAKPQPQPGRGAAHEATRATPPRAPSHATTPTREVSPNADPTPAHTAAHSAAAAPAQRDQGPAPAATTGPVTAHELGTGQAENQRASTVAAVVSPQVTAHPPADATMVSLAEWALSIGAGAGLLAGTLFTGMRVARRRRLRHRRPGRQLSSPALQHLPLEATLITDGAAAQRDVAFIDHALRVLAARLVAEDGRLPAVVAARLTGEHLDLVLADPQLDAPPAPWVPVSSTSWVVAKSADLPPLSELHPSPAAPYPTLVSVGCTPAGEEWLIDLEQAGALAFDGDPARCLDLARFIVAELAYNPWSDPLLVTVAGFGQELVGLNPERLVHTDDVAAAATVAGASIAANREVADSHQVDVLHGRLHGISGDTWMPRILVVAPQWASERADAEAVERLLQMAAQRSSRSAVAVVLTADRPAGSPAGLRLTVHPDGTLLIPDLEVVAAASQLPAEQAAALADYFAAERDGRVDVAMPPSRRESGSAEFCDAAGALREEFRSGSAGAASLREQRHNAAAVSDLTTGITLPEAGRAGEVTVRPELAEAVIASDPTLDTDLADWHNAASPRPKFDLLGPVQVHATGAVPTNKLQIVIEALIYLLLHPRGVTGDRFAADLWPKLNYVFAGDSNPRGIMTLARNWVGADPATGRDYLVKAAASKAVNGVGLYRLEGALDSIDLFYRLRTRGEARGRHGRDDLMAALRLVTGVPLSALRPRGFGWLTAADVSCDLLTSAIIDLADQVATMALATDHVDQAREAARIALLTETPDDRPLLVLAACQEREGRRAELGATVRRIIANHDEILQDDIPDATLEVLRRNGWLELVNAS